MGALFHGVRDASPRSAAWLHAAAAAGPKAEYHGFTLPQWHSAGWLHRHLTNGICGHVARRP